MGAYATSADLQVPKMGLCAISYDLHWELTGVTLQPAALLVVQMTLKIQPLTLYNFN